MLVKGDKVCCCVEHGHGSCHWILGTVKLIDGDDIILENCFMLWHKTIEPTIYKTYTFNINNCVKL